MRNKFVHDMLMFLADTERIGPRKDRFSGVMKRTLYSADTMAELLDDELEYIAAAEKREDMYMGDGKQWFDKGE